MRYRPRPLLDYHHIQPRAIRPPHHHPGDLNDRRARAAHRRPWWDPARRTRVYSRMWAAWF
jgi:hypothetical protein